MMRIFDKRSLVSQVMMIFLLSNIFVVILFTVYITAKDREATVKNLESSIKTIAAEKAKTLSLVMRQVVKETESYADYASEYMAKETSDTLPDSYKRRADGALYRSTIDGQKEAEYSSIFFPANVKLTPTTIKTINATEKLDWLVASMQKRNASIQWNYIATDEGLLRSVPYVPTDMYDPNHLQKRDPFYIVADQKNNPKGETVWSSPYVDYFGTGWMVTCAVPFYQGERFAGIACSDVRLEVIQKQFLEDLRLREESLVYLLDDEGNIIYHPTIAPENEKSGQKGQTFLTNIVEDTDLTKGYKTALTSVLKEKDGLVSYRDDQGRSHMIAYAKVEGQPWIVAIEINQNKYLQLNNLDKNNWWKFIAILLVVYILIFCFLYRQYSMPFKKLAEWGESIAAGNFARQKPIKNYIEVEMLSDTFNWMSAKIEEFTTSLIQKNKEIQNVIDGIGGMLLILSPEMEILNMNKKAAPALRRTREEILGRKCYEVVAGRTEICSGCCAKEALEDKIVKISRISINDDIFQNTYYPLTTFDEKASQIIVQSHKITKRMMLEEELSQSEKMSEIGQLTAAIAHELKTPLAIIKGSTYLLSAASGDNQEVDMAESLQTIIQSTEHAENVVYHLMDFSRPASGDVTHGDITKIVEQVVLLTNRERIRSDIEIITDFHPNPLIYNATVEPLKHIMMNLVTNAINAMKDGGEIHISGREEGGDKDEVRIIIKDNGPGIPEGLRKKIFDPFVTTDGSGDGVGLGLWITRLMVEKMQGTIDVESAEDEGTVFTIVLPAIKDDGGEENDVG